jgi:hypothetical protein
MGHGSLLHGASFNNPNRAWRLSFVNNVRAEDT